jgi:uroporphyrinogen decarboxylase
MAALIRNLGGVPVTAPSLREVPLAENPAAFAFGEALLGGEIDAVLFLTGVGTRQLIDVLETRFSRDEVLVALNRCDVIARGPKPVRVLRELGVSIDVTVPEPNTWREVIAAIQDSPRVLELSGCRIAVQEYGIPNDSLLEALAAKGAVVTRVPVYRWALPEDLGPLRSAIRCIVEEETPVLLLTNGAQVEHLIQLAAEDGREAELRSALGSCLIGSIGPTCTEVLRACGLRADVEPEHSRMGLLVHAAAEAVGASRFAATPSPPRDLPAAAPADRESPFLKACRREPVPYTPIWLMRQAGRYMSDYRELRARHSFLELCEKPDLVAEVTVTAVERIGADAAILFSDILLIVQPLGLHLEYTRGEGPVISPVVRTGTQVDALHEIDPEALCYVYDGVRATRRALDPKIPLIGFSGAPFTLASYVIEGGGSRNFEHTKALMYRDPGAWHALMGRISRGLVGYLRGQVAAGASCLQLFDSWVGCLSPGDYREFVLPHMRTLISALGSEVPVIHFGTGTATLLQLQREAGGDVIGLDWRIDLDHGWDLVGHDKAVQGNLDPLVLMAEPEYLAARAKQVLDQAGSRPGHIFNLGHGILPSTPVDNVIRLIDSVHELSRR